LSNIDPGVRQDDETLALGVQRYAEVSCFQSRGSAIFFPVG
jgi:hypothetical protein